MIDSILPYEFKESYDRVCIDNELSSYWIVKEFTGDVKIFEGIDKILNLPHTFFSMHISRQKSGEYLKKLTKVISYTNSEKKDLIGEQIDIDVLEKMSEEAKKLRQLVQLENEEIYEVNIFLGIMGKDNMELKENIKTTENIAYTNGFHIIPANFREKQVYFSTLPTRNQDKKIQELTRKVFTTSSLCSLFPFYTTKFIENEGIIVGNTFNTICMIDFQNKSNNNKNIVVFGSSGAGKSYYIKLMVLQYLYRGVRQIIIDPQGEYVNIANKFHQRVITKDNYNILEIDEGYVKLYPKIFLQLKIQQICDVLKHNNLNINISKKQEICSAIENTYNSFGINSNVNSLYRYGDQNNVYSKKRYIDYTMFPNIKDLKKEIMKLKLNKKELKEIIDLLSKYETNCKENEIYEQNIIVFNMSVKSMEYLTYIMHKLQEYCAPNTFIYIDEMWQVISSDVLNIDITISDMFKTIRKTGAGIVAITQDICDVLSYKSGDFGKCILNNANTKIYFKMEYLDIDNLNRLIVDQNGLMENIKKLTKGHAVVDYGGNIFELEVKGSKYENQIIEGVMYEKDFNSNGK